MVVLLHYLLVSVQIWYKLEFLFVILNHIFSVFQSEAMEKVPKLVHFLIDHCVEVLGEETIHLYGEPPVDATSTTKQRDSSTDSDSMNSLLSGHSYPPNGMYIISHNIDKMPQNRMTLLLNISHLFNIYTLTQLQIKPHQL